MSESTEDSGVRKGVKGFTEDKEDDDGESATEEVPG